MANKYTRKGQSQTQSSDDAALAEKDEFVGFWERAYKAVEPHLRNLAIAGGVVVGLTFVGWGVSSWMTSSREDATEMFARAVRLHEADLLPEEKADKDAKDGKDGKDAANPAAPEAKKSDDADEVPRFKTAAERANATLAEIEKLEKAHGSNAVAQQARLFKAGVLYELGRYDDAAKLAREFADSAKSGSGPLATIAREDEGLILESQGKLDDALKVYGQLAEGGADFFRDRALLDKARVMVRKGDAAGAKDIYKKIIEKQPSGPLHDEATERLGAIGG